jgi:hypothetical protein
LKTGSTTWCFGGGFAAIVPTTVEGTPIARRAQGDGAARRGRARPARRLDLDEKGISTVDTLGGSQKMLIKTSIEVLKLRAPPCPTFASPVHWSAGEFASESGEAASATAKPSPHSRRRRQATGMPKARRMKT